MRLSDAALPAIPHLVGDGAFDVLSAPVEAAGGALESIRAVQVQYRPGSDVVVRYRAGVSWAGGPVRRETLMASTTFRGAPTGTVPVRAETADGELEIGAWRWPFDPVLSGLGHCVDRSAVATMLDRRAKDLQLKVVAFHPTLRSVIRVSSRSSDEVVAYLKVIAPQRTRSVRDRHDRLTDAGVPAPRVLDADDDLGVLVLQPLIGPSLRDEIKSGRFGAVPTSELDRLADAFARADLGEAVVPCKLTDAIHHARVLGAVLPTLRSTLDRLTERFADATGAARATTIHGDLHEGQVIVRDGRIVGVLDVDDAGLGTPVEDRANVIARLRYRQALAADGGIALGAEADRFRAGSVDRFGRTELDLYTSAALIGLSTVPFSRQGERWRDDVTTLVERAAMRGVS